METTPDQPCQWRRVEAIALWLLMVAPLVTDPFGENYLVSQFKAIYINIFAVLLACSFVLRSFFRCGFRFIPSMADVPLVCFLLLAGASILWSINHSVHLQRFTLLASTCLCFYLIRIRLAEGDSVLKNVVLLLCMGTLVALIDSFELVLYRIRSMGAAGAGEGGSLFKAGSFLFPHNNVASIFIVLFVPLAYALVFCVRRAWQRFLCVLSLLVLLLHLVLLHSRAAMIEAVLGILVITACLALRKKLVPFFQSAAVLLQKRPVLLLLAVVVLVLFLLPLSDDFRSHAKAGFSRMVDFFGLQYERSYFRLDVWRKTMAMVADHVLLGVGLGNFPVIFPAYHKLDVLKSHAHSEYYNILAELGVIGLILYILFIVFLFKSFIVVFHRGQGWERVLALGLGVALLLECLHGFVEPPMIFEASALTMFFCFGLLTSLENRVLGREPMVFGPGGKVRRYVLPALCLAGPFLAVPKLAMGFAQGPGYEKAMAAMNRGRFAEAERIYRRISGLSWDSHVAHINIGDACFRQGKFEEAYEEYLKAEALFPHYFKIHFNKGVTLLELGRPMEANQALEECYRYNPGFNPREFWQIRALIEMKAFDLGLRRLDAYLRAKRPTSAELKIGADFYYKAYQCVEREKAKKIRDLKKALEYFERCLRMGGAAEFPDLEAKTRHLRQLLRLLLADKDH